MPVGEVVVQEAGQLGELLRKLVGPLVQPLRTAQRGGGGAVGAGRAAEAEVDAAGGHRLQRAELLGDHQRRVVGQHDAAGAEPDAVGVRGEVRQQDRGGRGGHPGHRVVLGDPVAVEAAALGRAGDADGGAYGLGGGVSRAHGHQVQYGQGDGRGAEGRAPDAVAVPGVAGPGPVAGPLSVAVPAFFVVPDLVVVAAHGAGPPRVAGLPGE